MGEMRDALKAKLDRGPPSFVAVALRPKLAEPGPIKSRLLQPATEEEIKQAAKDKAREAQRRECTLIKSDTPPAPALPPKPKTKRYLVSLTKCEVDYYLEYEMQPDKSWRLIDCPPQLAGLHHVPISEHQAEWERAAYTEWAERRTLWR